MWLCKLQNTVQMILLINNNKSNSQWQRERLNFWVTQAYTPNPSPITWSMRPHFVPFAEPGQHSAHGRRPPVSGDWMVVGTSSPSLLPSGPEDKVPFLLNHDKPAAKQSEHPRLCSPLGPSGTEVSGKMDYLHG